jgi:hypothetical protein
MRTISLSDQAPRRVTTMNSSPAMPARRVASVTGDQASARGVSPSVKPAMSVDVP